jgi:hypothetical protein
MLRRRRVDFYVNIPVELVARLVPPCPRLAELDFGPAADRQQLLAAAPAIFHPEGLRAGRPHQQVQASAVVQLVRARAGCAALTVALVSMRMGSDESR